MILSTTVLSHPGALAPINLGRREQPYRLFDRARVQTLAPARVTTTIGGVGLITQTGANIGNVGADSMVMSVSEAWFAMPDPWILTLARVVIRSGQRYWPGRLIIRAAYTVVKSPSCRESGYMKYNIYFHGQHQVTIN